MMLLLMLADVRFHLAQIHYACICACACGFNASENDAEERCTRIAEVKDLIPFNR